MTNSEQPDPDVGTLGNAEPDSMILLDCDAVTVVTLRGEHDMATAAELRNLIATAKADKQSVVLDLTEVEFIDSTVIANVLRAHQDLGSRFALQVATAPTVRRVLEITGVLEVVPCAATRYEAIALALGPPDLGAS